jgi:hypothetical protein
MAMMSRILSVMTMFLAVLPIHAAERQLNDSRRFPSAEGKRVVIDVGTLNLRVRAADVEDIEVVTDLKISGVGGQKAETWIDAHTPVIDDREEELRIATSSGKSSFLGLGHLTARSRLGVVVPTHVALDLTTTSGTIQLRGDFPFARPLRLRTSAADITFEGAAATLDIRSAGGNTEVTVFRPLDRLFARTSSGNVSVRGGARQVEVDTASGNVWIGNLSGPAQVETSTGKITLQWDHLDPDDHVVVRSASGKVDIVLPPGVQPQGSLTTTTGSIRCDFQGEWNDREDSLRLIGDGPTLDVETASSEITASHGRADFD